MTKLHSASPPEITSPFPCAIISKLHSKTCNYLYKLVSLKLNNTGIGGMKNNRQKSSREFIRPFQFNFLLQVKYQQKNRVGIG